MNRLFLALACGMFPIAASAQTDQMQMLRLMSANQVGIMEYCQGKGWADQEAVDSQKASFSSLPPGAGTTETASAEATGKSGSFMNNAKAVPLSTMAGQSNMTEQGLCEKLAGSAKTAAAQRRSMPQSPSGLPGMPNGMPAMPNGMTPPAMPQMPKNAFQNSCTRV